MYRIDIVYNNILYDPKCIPSWGMACVVETPEKKILFDTGENGATLLSNLEKLGIQPRTIDIVLLSHIHTDHTGGLWRCLEENPYASVYLPDAFPADFKERARRSASRVVEVTEPVKIATGVFSTGVLGSKICEQALVLYVGGEIVLVTGCCHPGVKVLIERALEVGEGPVRLITGGFHLKDTHGTELEAAIRSIRDFGIRNVGPSHCTGEKAIEAFRRTWGAEFVEAGCGAGIQV